MNSFIHSFFSRGIFTAAIFFTGTHYQINVLKYMLPYEINDPEKTPSKTGRQE